MTSALKHHHNQHASSKPPKHPFSAAAAEPHISNPNPIPNIVPAAINSPIMIPQEDTILSRATHLTRPELLRRRSHRLKQLSKCYRDYYWVLMEDLKSQYREYYWRFGVSPFKEEQNQKNQISRLGLGGEAEDGDAVEGSGENVNSNGGSNWGKGDLDLKTNYRCSYMCCKFKTMPLTSFCHLHILSDSKQRLYKACNYVIKRTQAGPLICGKPILRSTIPSLCNGHFQKAQKHVTRALKDAGHVSSSSKLAPKFHVIVAEFVRQIQAERRVAPKDDKAIVKEENGS